MDKNNILSIVLMGILAVGMFFVFRTCESGGADNLDYLSYGTNGVELEYKSLTDAPLKSIKGSNDLVEFEFDTAGAVLNKYTVKSKQNVTADLILDNESGNKPFSIYWGNDRQNPVNTPFNFKDLSSEDKIVYEFSSQFLDNNGKEFTLYKTFTLLNDSYMFKMDIAFDSTDKSIPDIGINDYAYSVYYGPQLGPEYKQLSKKESRISEYRTIQKNLKYEKDNKLETLNRSHIIDNTMNTNGVLYYMEDLNIDKVNWVALTGKYFTFIADIPENVKHLYYVSDSVDINDAAETNMIYENEFFMTHLSFEKYDDLTTSYYFYLGPKTREHLKTAQESFGRKDLDFLKLPASSFLGLDKIVGSAISFINYGINNTGIKNWGWSIVIFTIVLKVLLFGLTRKSYESTSKMQQIGPKINELKEKFKDKPQEMNAAMADLYKKEGVNPMMGCLPMLLQFPILIAVFSFINSSYELRGQSFLWLADLSAQDATIAFPFEIPFLGWTSLNILPVLYVITQLISTIVMQPSRKSKGEKGQANGQQLQMKLMQYGLPLIFFFVLYSYPSGLFVYWITMNIVTTLQQLIYNKFYKGKDKGKKGPGLMERIQKLATTKKA